MERAASTDLTGRWLWLRSQDWCDRVFVSSRSLSLSPFSFAVSGRADAQLLYGSIVGAVVDAQGATVPGARVTIVNRDTNFSRDALNPSYAERQMRLAIRYSF